jgi:thiamine-phosphate pyrophosphorylase
MLVTDRQLAGGEDALVRAVDEAIEGGVNAVQLREKDMRPAELLPLACRLREVTEGRALLLVNGPLEIALEARADGVHLPADAEPPPPPWTFTWGRSVHSAQEAFMAMGEAPRYLIAGPIYATRSHPGAHPAGLSLIREITPITRVPLIAIGGITPKNARDVMQAGAHGIAVISAILGSDDAKAAAQSLAKAFEFVPVRKFFP